MHYLHNSVSIFVDKSLGDAPLPMLLVAWPTPGGDDFGMELFRTLKRVLNPQRTWESAHHRWAPHVWRSDKVKAVFSYRDAADGEYLTCSVVCPDLFSGAAGRMPELRQDNPPPLIDAARMSAADRLWWDWKAAYQHTQYYLFAYGKPATWRHHQHLNRVPTLLLTEIDFSEIGPQAKIHEETAAAKAAIQKGAHRQ